MQQCCRHAAGDGRPVQAGSPSHQQLDYQPLDFPLAGPDRHVPGTYAVIAAVITTSTR